MRDNINLFKDSVQQLQRKNEELEGQLRQQATGGSAFNQNQL